SGGACSFPCAILIAISQALTALTKTLFAGVWIAARARAVRRGLLVSDHINALVSSSRFILVVLAIEEPQPVFRHVVVKVAGHPDLAFHAAERPQLQLRGIGDQLRHGLPVFGDDDLLTCCHPL